MSIGGIEFLLNGLSDDHTTPESFLSARKALSGL
jgi:hypothetical protein